MIFITVQSSKSALQTIAHTFTPNRLPPSVAHRNTASLRVAKKSRPNSNIIETLRKKWLMHSFQPPAFCPLSFNGRQGCNYMQLDSNLPATRPTWQKFAHKSVRRIWRTRQGSQKCLWSKVPRWSDENELSGFCGPSRQKQKHVQPDRDQWSWWQVEVDGADKLWKRSASAWGTDI